MDTRDVNQYRVYTQWKEWNGTQIVESAWNSDGQLWKVEPVTKAGVDAIKQGTPIAAMTGYPHTNTSLDLVRKHSQSGPCLRCTLGAEDH
jgi:hypothetical protein